MRLIGYIILILGVIVFLISQVMEITIEPDYANLEIEAIKNLPDKVVNLELIANKINFTIIGSLLIIVGLQLSLSQNNKTAKNNETKNNNDFNLDDANNPKALNDFIKKLNE